MSVELILILSFVVLAGLFIVFVPGKNLSEVFLDEGESPLFDQDKVTVVEKVSVGTDAVHIRCRVSVTNRRVIVSQLPLLGKKYQLIMVLYFADGNPPEKTGLEGRVKTGVLERKCGGTAYNKQAPRCLVEANQLQHVQP